MGDAPGVSLDVLEATGRALVQKIRDSCRCSRAELGILPTPAEIELQVWESLVFVRFTFFVSALLLTAAAFSDEPEPRVAVGSSALA